MDIKSELLSSHSKETTLKIIAYVGDDKLRFKTLINIFLGEDARLTQRAAWPISYAAIAFPGHVEPYFKLLLSKLNAENNHPAVKRNILRMFQEIEIPEKYQSELIDSCFKIIVNPAETIAAIAFAISTATKLCKPYPELVSELILILDHLSTYPQKPAITSRIKHALKSLKGLK